MLRPVFHIGSLKTGSTSAQESFDQARAALARHGLHYASGSKRHGYFKAMARRVTSLGPPGSGKGWSKPGPARLNSRTALVRNEVAALQSGTYLLSSEAMFSLDAEEIAALKTVLADIFGPVPVTMLAYVRHPVGYTVSDAQEIIKRQPVTLGEVEARGYDGRLRVTVEAYRTVFGAQNVVVRPYDTVVKSGRTVEADILETLGHGSAIDDVVVRRLNTSLTMNAVLVADRLNAMLAADGIGRGHPTRKAKAERLQAIEGPKFAFSQRGLDHVRGQCAEDVAWFNETFDLGLVDPEPLPREAIAADLLDAGEIERRAREILAAVERARARAARRGVDPDADRGDGEDD